MSNAPRGFTEDTASTPLVDLPGKRASGPKRPCLLVVAGARLGEIFPIDGEILIGRDPEAQLRLGDDEGISRRHARVVPSPSGDSATISDLGSANGVYVDGEKIQERVLSEGQKIKVGQTTVLKFARYDNVEEQAQRQLLESALRDGTTHAFNRRYFLQRLGAEVRFADRHQQKLALLIIDLDHFKQVNDSHGHHAGDEVLRQLVTLLGHTLRAEDVLARFGGEEFAVLARGIPEGGALQLAERLRKLVEATEFMIAQRPLRCTVSVGVAVFPFEGAKGETAAEKFIERADAALYRAKQAGRNQVAK
jgi:two-component system cell cycle response regulator